MFQNNNFVRVRRRGPETVLIQFILLAFLFFVCMIGVVAFMHFSSSQTNASIAAPQTQSGAGGDMVDVIVPIDNIESGATLDPSMFRRDKRPSIAISTETVRDFEEIKGLFSRGVLIANQPIHREFLTSLQPVNALTASIPTGYRAIAIPVDATSSVEGWAQPGTRVDVVWVTEATGRKTATVVAQNAKVLSANQMTEATASEDPREKGKNDHIPTTVTLLLTTRDSLRVRLAALNGRLSLILRGQDSGASVPIGTINTENLSSGINRSEPAPARNLVTVQVKDRKSGKVEEMTFEGGQRVAE